MRPRSASSARSLARPSALADEDERPGRQPPGRGGVAGTRETPRPSSVASGAGELAVEQQLVGGAAWRSPRASASSAVDLDAGRRRSRMSTWPPASRRRCTRRPPHSGSQMGSAICAGDLAERCGRRPSAASDGRRRLGHRGWHRRARLSRGAIIARGHDRRPAGGHAARSGGLAGLTPSRPRASPGRVVAVRLREHDLQLRGRVQRDRALADRRARFGERDGQLRPQRRDRRERRAQRARLADPRRAQRPRRPAAAVPAVLHGAVHRPDACSSASAPALVGAVLFIVANFAYQAALIYYDATLKTVSQPETRGRLSGIGVAIGYVRHDLRRAADPALLGIPVGRPVFLVAGVLFARLRRTDLPLRPRAGADRPRSPGADVVGSLAQLRADDRARARGARAAALPASAGSSTPTR